MTTPQLSPGTVVDGRYRVGALVRSRPGAATYVASDPQAGEVHLTVYGAACFPSPLLLERSLRELRQLQGLQSARVVAVLACGKLPDGGLYEVNPSTSDATLADHLARGPLQPVDAAQVATAIGEALLEAQKVGVIHRNLAAYVVFPGEAGVRVGAFAVGEPHGPQSFGPPETMAPEQVEGKVVDQRTLIYNLGALMHQMLAGAPVFAGDPATQLHHHASTEVPAELHPTLRRALSKDARMRPMMLKQFLLELRALGGPGAQAPAARASAGAGPAPSARGWTMFMNEGDGGQARPAPAPAAAPAAPTPAQPPVAAPPAAGPAVVAAPLGAAPAAGAASVAAPPLPGAAPKPSTRGWTMFMKEEGGSEGSEAAPPPAAAPVQPRTRGWTMFTEAAPEDEPPASGPAQSSAAPASAGAAVPPPAAAGGPAPKTRGWTMFMNEGDGEAPSGEAAAAAAAPAQPEPATAAQVAAPPGAPAADAPKPRTRGWTMFTEAADDDAAPSGPASGTPVAAPPMSASPAAVAAPPSVGGAPSASPSTRGWTVFGAPAPGAAPAPEPSPAPEPDAPELEPAPKKQRGWTMFMESPLPAGRGELGGPKAAPAAAPAATDAAAADQKGWTVFGTPAPDLAAEVALAREELEAAAPASQAPSGPPARSHTVMASAHVPRPPLDPTPAAPTPISGSPGPTAAGHTVMSGAAPLQRPDELAPPSSPAVLGVSHPSGAPMHPSPSIEQMMPMSGSAPLDPPDMAPAGGSKTWLWVVLGAVALGAIGTTLAFVL